MGLYSFEVEIIARLAKRRQDTALPRGRRLRVLSIGHPDILATPKELSFLGPLPIDNKEVREARSLIPKENVVGNARPVFDAMGADLFVVDIRKDLYNIDREADFNFPLDLENGPFDIVIDGGATEHCFNVGQALKNIAEHVDVGGFVYHMVPLCHWNHGFWNFSPGVFADFYDEPNGFVVEKLEAEYRNTFIPVQPNKKFEIPNRGRKLNLICVARKTASKKITFPMQRKYR